MKECLQELYNLEVIGFIRLSKYVYKVKTKDQFYCLKYTTNIHLERMYEHICSLQMNCFVRICKNKEKHILSKYHDQYFYLMPYLEMDQGIVKELKIKYYLETISNVHNSSFFQCAISKDYFKKQVQDISNTLESRKKYYQTMMNNYENMYYRSPSGWMFVLNYYRLKRMLEKVTSFMDEYQMVTKEIHHLRVCLVYQHFDYQHIMMKQQTLISIDKIDIMQCIYDIYVLYQSSIDFIYDFDVLFEYYLSRVHLQKQEKVLLSSLLCLVPIIELEQDEVHNIINMARLFYYIDSIEGLLEQLKE
ncbi:hypothetical protein [Tannockella kyphosi]|uniref:hypothetical protein n=1 Tax=Tannockella kyphosi TaxID=2899121 RepID=UPI002012FEB2|nr:hypothetical protein [Tannockella kyphosi]